MSMSWAPLRRNVFRSLASLSLLSVLTACGFKGPLYMPPPPPPDAALTIPPEAGTRLTADTPVETTPLTPATPVHASP